MKKEINIPLQEIEEIIEAGRYYSSCHNSDPANPDGLDPWALIESITDTLDNIFGEFISSYQGGKLPHIKAIAPKFQLYDKVEITAMPIMCSKTGMINYVGIQGVILEILDNGNYWVGINQSIPCAEFSENSLKSI